MAEKNRFASVLKKMYEYIERSKGGFYTEYELIYCPSCDAIQSATGSYRKFEGNDCLGAHHSHVERGMCCDGCKSEKFLSLYPPEKIDFERMKPKKLISLISRANIFDFPSLYNENLPAVIKAWEKLSVRQKVMIITNARMLAEGLKAGKAEVKRLEAMLA